MEKDQIIFRVEDKPFLGKYGISAFNFQTRAYAESIIMTTASDGEYIAPFIHLTKDSMQSLFDEMYKCGFRPSEVIELGSSTNKAQQSHIDDLRKITFKTLGIK